MKWTIKRNPSNQKWYFSVSEIGNKADCVFPGYGEIKTCAQQEGIPLEDLIGEQQFQYYFDKIIYNKTLPLPLEIELEPSFDARLIIEQDKTKATLYIRKAKDDPQNIDRKLITTLLHNSGIANIDTKALDEKINAFIAAKTREREIVIAEGILPERGADRTLISHITTLSEEEAHSLRKKMLHAVETAREQPKVIYDKDFPLSEAESLAIVAKGSLLFEFSKSELGASGQDVYGNPIQGLPGNDPFVHDLRNIEQNNDELRAGCSGILLSVQTADGLKLRIIPYKEATVEVIVSDDKMSISLIMESGRGAGARLSRSQLKKTLDAVHLPEARYTDQVLREAIYKARTSSAPVEFTVCRGKPPVAPHSYRFDWKVDFAHSNAVSVQRGEPILEAVLIEEGEKGQDVFGTTIEISTAVPVTLPKTDDTIRVVKQEKNISLIAAVHGELIRTDEKLTIISSKEIDTDLDEQIEHIDFAGDISINGDVRSGCSVRAGGSLFVNGHAHDSLLYTKDSLTIHGGIRGENHGTLWAKNIMSLDFAESARLLAGGNISIDQYSFRCVIKTNGKLIIHGEPGSFIGGNAHAARGISVRNLGDYKTVRTIVSFGQDYLVKDRIDVYEKQIQENLTELTRIEAELTDTETTADRIDELREQKVIMLKSNRAMGLKIFKLKENFESHIPSEVRITGTVYPGVILETHGRYYEVREPAFHVVFTFDEQQGRIICKQIEEDDEPTTE